MCAHVFGGVSSGAYSNYICTEENCKGKLEEIWNWNCTHTLRENFYVGDLLKSVNSEDDIIKQIKNVRPMCNEDGFNLTKFISNSKKVLHSIPEIFRRNGVANYLMNKHWVSCGMKKLTLGLKIAIKEKPLTRRGMLSTLSSIYDPLGLCAPFLLKGKQIIQTLCAQRFR